MTNGLDVRPTQGHIEEEGEKTKMPGLFHVCASEAPAAEYNVPGLSAVSHRVVTHQQSEKLAVYYAKMESPLDYTFAAEQDLVFYQLEGMAHVSAGGAGYDLRPHEAIHIPGNLEIHHTAKEPTATLIIWGPAPLSDEHEH